MTFRVLDLHLVSTHHDDDSDRYPGDELGLPAEGPGSLAPFGRRLLALFIDWGVAMLIGTFVASLFTASDDELGGQLPGMMTLGVFALMHILGVGALGITIGKLLLRTQVVRGTQAPGIGRAALRTALILLVIPPLVISMDGRGAHDRIAGTVQLRM